MNGKIRPTMDKDQVFKVRSPILLARFSMSRTVTTDGTGVSEHGDGMVPIAGVMRGIAWGSRRRGRYESATS